jgi:hypothetical protein
MFRFQAGSISQANPLSEVYSYYNANSQTIEGVFVKKVCKNFHRFGIGSQLWMSL